MTKDFEQYIGILLRLFPPALRRSWVLEGNVLVSKGWFISSLIQPNSRIPWAGLLIDQSQRGLIIHVPITLTFQAHRTTFF